MKQRFAELVTANLRRMAMESGYTDDDLPEAVIEKPPKSELGDFAVPLFPFAKVLRRSPAQIAESLVDLIAGEAASMGRLEANGPYVNLFIDPSGLAAEVLTRISAQGDEYGKNRTMAGRRVIVEFSCPNTNKPLHLGHLRNDAIGESTAALLAACGADVVKVNLINDRGIHICKSMAAYARFGSGKTPESENRKSDHFVGDFYVRFDTWSKQEPDAGEKARELLRLWENGDPQTVALWKQMNTWAISGIQETYRRTGVSFDQTYHESKTYHAGKQEILDGLSRNIFTREEDGSVWVDLTAIGLDKRVLLRSDGTSLYLTQDIGTAIARYRDWKFDSMIYVVASEQQYHFKGLFHVLEQLGFSWAKDLFHLSYGMVNLPSGKMKSREGTVVDADDLLDSLAALAHQEIAEREREGEVEDPGVTAEKIALGALYYYLLQVSPGKDMIFNPEESISFTGNTGPYLQYMGARICSLLAKFSQRKTGLELTPFDAAYLTAPEEKGLVSLLAEYPGVVLHAAREYNPSVITAYLYELTKLFSRYYHDYPILNNQDPGLVKARITLCIAVHQVLRNAFRLIRLPFLTKM